MSSSKARLSRDLAAECRNVLQKAGAATAVEIARGVRARNADVRAALRSDPMVTLAPVPPGRRSNSKLYTLAALPVPSGGTVAEGFEQQVKTSGPRGVHEQLRLELVC
jgi:hypothetical protein